MKSILYAIVFVITASIIPVASAQSTLQNSAGTNVKDDSGTVWYISAENCRAAYTSAGAFLSYGFNEWWKVVEANPANYSLPACGSEVTGYASVVPPRDGRIICADRGNEKGTCYLITKGKKAAFVSEAVFKQQGFTFTNAIYGDVSWMIQAPNIENGTFPHLIGTLFNDNGTIKLVIQGNGDATALSIDNPETFASWGFKFNEVVPANSHSKFLPVDGLLKVRPSSGKLFPTNTDSSNFN